MSELLNETIEAATETLAQFDSVQTLLADAIAGKAEISYRMRELDCEIKTEESIFIFDLEQQAQNKEGPLAGIAKTGAAYKAGIEAELAKAKANGGTLGRLHRKRKEFAVELYEIEAAKDVEATRFSALKYQSNLQVALINALSS